MGTEWAALRLARENLVKTRGQEWRSIAAIRVAVVYRPDFTIDYAAQVPYETVVELAKYDEHTKAYRFLMRRSVLGDPRVTDIAQQLTA